MIGAMMTMRIRPIVKQKMEAAKVGILWHTFGSGFRVYTVARRQQGTAADSQKFSRLIRCDKIEQVSAMLALFMRRACSVECLRVAHLVGNVDDDADMFNQDTKKQFDKLLSLQGEDDLDVLVVEKLRAKENDNGARSGMEGVGIKELVTSKLNLHLVD